MKPPMDDEYAKLSLLAGIFAAAADTYLGKLYFVEKIRAECWELTVEKLAAWKAEAIAMGVPPDALNLTKAMQRMIPDILKTAKKLQEESDKVFFRKVH